MQKRKVWRYKCDYCKKANCSGFHMAKHEQGCTNNPSRVCGMCKLIARYELAEKPPLPLSEALKLLPILDENSTIDLLMEGSGAGSTQAKYLETLRSAVNYCPACTLAVIRQSPPFSAAHYVEFDYKAAAKSFWEDVNNERVE